MSWICCIALAGSIVVQEPVSAPPGKGVTARTEQALPGYTLIAPLRSNETVLIDEAGTVVHRWQSEFTPGNAAELLPNGDLLRAGKVGGNGRFHGGGEGGVLEQFTWDGELVWRYDLSTDGHLHHHDFEVLPNGNVLVIVWEGRTAAEARAAGRRPNSVGEAGLWPDAIWELEPVRPDGAEIVWTWSAWDHLIQDHDPELPNYGDPAEHPERIDINIGAAAMETPETEAERRAREEEERRLRALGYIGDDDEPEDDGGRDGRGADWMHTNSVDYDAQLDLIAISVRNFSEVFVIDHSTTSAEAAGSTGGRFGRGGDLLWRWGHSANHRGAAERLLFGQHDARWLRDGDRVAISVFNNGDGRPAGEYSSVDLVHLPIDGEGRFAVATDAAAPAAEAAWSYVAEAELDFFSSHISGAEPLPGGRFLVCEGDDGRVFQVDRSGALLWEFRSPFGGDAGRGGPPRGGRGPGRGEGPPGAPRPDRGSGADGDPGPPGGRGDAGGRGGPRSATALFRAVHVPRDHPALAGRLSAADGD